MVGWQWVFIFWGIPAVILGILMLFYLTDRPAQARWLTDEERTALEETLAREKLAQKQLVGHMTIRQALANPKVLALAAAYFFVVTGSYGVEFYMASIVEDWYGMNDARRSPTWSSSRRSGHSSASAWSAGIRTALTSAAGMPRCRSSWARRLWSSPPTAKDTSG